MPTNPGASRPRPAPSAFCTPARDWHLQFGVTTGPTWFLHPPSTRRLAPLEASEARDLHRDFASAIHQWIFVSSVRAALHRKQAAFAAAWPIDKASLSDIFNGHTVMNHPQLAVLRTAIPGRYMPDNRTVQRYLDGHLSLVDETLTLLTPQQRGRAISVQTDRWRQQNAMNFLGGVIVSIDPDEIAAFERGRAIHSEALGPLVRAAAAASEFADGRSADQFEVRVVSEADVPFAAGDVVDGEIIIGTVCVSRDWLDQIHGQGWSMIDGHLILGVDLWDDLGRPVGVRVFTVVGEPALPWLREGEDAPEVAEDLGLELSLDVGVAQVRWPANGQPRVTRL